MNLIWTKVIVAILFGLLRLTFGLLPIKLYSYLKIWQMGSAGINHVDIKRQKCAECWLTLIQSFGGGVLFATCFLHMMPEVYHAVIELEEHYSIIKRYPYSQLLICTGFFMIYFIEEISQFVISRSDQIFTKTESIGTSSSASNKVSPVLQDKKSFEEASVVEDEKCDDCDKKSVDSGLDKSNEDLDIPMPTSERDLIMSLEESSSQKMLRNILITMALSFHAVFEGIAIGLQNSVTNIWYIFIAISIHSVTLLFCVGVKMLLSNKKPIAIFGCIGVLSLTSPLGIFIGLAVTSHTGEENQGTAIASALLEALSAGTMLYITFFEVLSREKELRILRLKRGVCIISGFIIMALLQALE